MPTSDPLFPDLDLIDTKHKLHQKCLWWQKVLRLKDWNIRVRFTRPGEIESQGRVSWQAKTMSAVIKIRPYEQTPDGEFRDPIEKTLVHELLHLQLWYLKELKNEFTPTEYAIYEHSIDKTAWGLVERHYQLPPQSLDDFQNYKPIEYPEHGID